MLSASIDALLELRRYKLTACQIFNIMTKHHIQII